MRAIWKWPIPRGLPGTFKLEMPWQAVILDVQFQGMECVIWALVETDFELETRTFEVYWTGHRLPDDLSVREYRGTCQDKNNLVWHLFESHKKT